LKKTFEGGEPYGFLLEKYHDGEVVVVDVETTDFSSPLVEVVEIAAIKVKEGQIVGKFHRYLKNSIPVGASERVHRISDEFLRQHGEEPEDVFGNFRQFITGNLLIGHNLSFDLRVLHEQASRLGIQILFDHWEDTLDISRRFILSERYDLEYLATLLGLKHLPEHRAKEDAYCTFDLLHHLTKTIKKDTIARGRVVSRYGKTFQPLANLIHSWRNQTKIKRPPELLDIVFRESGLGDYYEEDKRRISYINELRQIFKEKDNPELDAQTSLLELINFAALSRNIDYLSKNDNRIPIITLHQAKGLEFDVVFIAGASEGEIPHYYSVKEGRLEEEKRLFYVGLTRAKKNLIISGYRRNQWGYSKGSSQFISYLPNDAIRRT
jgi:DNA helicase-2/ATP-dependent DNA helicase PcrA